MVSLHGLSLRYSSCRVPRRSHLLTASLGLASRSFRAPGLYAARPVEIAPSTGFKFWSLRSFPALKNRALTGLGECRKLSPNPDLHL